MGKTKQEQIADKEREIVSLRNALTAATSEYGDYHIIKVYEARLMGKPDPYDIEPIISKREEMRTRINELQDEIERLANG